MRLKMIGLAAIAAFAAMAFVGASSASAGHTALCSQPELTLCADGNLVKHVHEVDTQATLITDILTILCTALFLGDVLSPYLASPLHILGNFTYSGCVRHGSGSCEVKELNGPALLTLLRTGSNQGVLTGEGEVLVKCGVFIHCVYNGEGLEGHSLGASGGSTGVNETHEAVVNNVSGFLCPDESELDALFRPLTNTYIST